MNINEETVKDELLNMLYQYQRNEIRIDTIKAKFDGLVRYINSPSWLYEGFQCPINEHCCSQCCDCDEEDIS